jgi:hypothetical protein
MMRRLLHQMIGSGRHQVGGAAFHLFYAFQNTENCLTLGAYVSQRLTCSHLKLIDLFSLDINSDLDDLAKRFGEFYTAYNIVADQWNEFAGRQIPCTTFSSDDDGRFY